MSDLVFPRGTETLMCKCKFGNQKKNRRGIAAVEVAVCLPLFMVISFGFISCGLLVQLKSNSKLVGHLAASEIVQAASLDASTIGSIDSKYEQLASDIGIRGLAIQIIDDSAGNFTVRTSVSYQDNYSSVPFKLQSDAVSTETFVFAGAN